MRSELRKRCRCKATSSGPRYVQTTKRLRVGYHITAKLVPMACDACNRPWTPIKIKSAT